MARVTGAVHATVLETAAAAEKLPACKFFESTRRLRGATRTPMAGMLAFSLNSRRSWWRLQAHIRMLAAIFGTTTAGRTR